MPCINSGRKESDILPFPKTHCSWLQQQEDNMVAGEVKPPTLDQPPAYMGGLETGACTSGRAWIVSRKEKEKVWWGRELVLFLKKPLSLEFYPYF